MFKNSKNLPLKVQDFANHFNAGFRINIQRDLATIGDYLYMHASCITILVLLFPLCCSSNHVNLSMSSNICSSCVLVTCWKCQLAITNKAMLTINSTVIVQGKKVGPVLPDITATAITQQNGSNYEVSRDFILRQLYWRALYRH